MDAKPDRMATLTVDKLVADLGLELAAGRARAGNSVRWVHISGEVDPTPWLSGGELLLTSGTQLLGDDDRARFIDRLAAHELAGVGIGLGESAPGAPPALLEHADRAGLPLFEVPYSMPFITITETAMARLVNERYEILRRGVDVQQALENLVLEGRGLGEIAATIGTAVDGAVAILDVAGGPLACHDPGWLLGPAALASVGAQVVARECDPRPFIATDPDLPSGAFARPVMQPSGRRPRAWIVALTEDGRLGELMRLVIGQAVSIVGLELGRDGHASETERQLTRQVMLYAQGDSDPGALAKGLEAFGIEGDVCVLIFELPGGASPERDLQAALAAERLCAAVATQPIDGRELLCAIVEPGDRDPLEVAAAARAALGADLGREPGVAASRSGGTAHLARAFREAGWALRATGGEGVGSWQNLGPESLLLSIDDPEVLRLYRDRLLGPIESQEPVYAAELLRSLETFIALNGQWERAAKQLHCHRHTLRYRIEKIEGLTGRDLAAATDRIEFWLALRARELA
jgi:PucR family transcriptional regulator, purine catabolism regulatory protein